MAGKQSEDALDPVIRVLMVPRLQEAPAPWMEQAIEWVSSREAARAEGPLSRVRSRVAAKWNEIRASLVLDTGFTTALQGIRGTNRGQPRQLLFDSPVGQVQIRCLPAPNSRVQILGQFLPGEGSILKQGPRAVLLRHGGKETVRRLQGTGEFRFASVAPGRAGLTLEWNGTRLVLDEVELSTLGT